MNARALRCIQTAADIGDTHTLPALPGVQQLKVALESQTAIRLKGSPQAGFLVRSAGHREDAAFAIIRCDSLSRANAAHFVNGIEHDLQQIARDFFSKSSAQCGGSHGKTRGAPTAISARSPKAHDFFFYDGDSQIGTGTFQIVGGPEARIAGAEDGNIHFFGAGERSTWGQVLSGRVHPKTVL